MAPPNDADDITMTPAVTDIPKDSAAGDKSKSSDSEKKDKDPKADEAEELSEEDQKLKDDLEMLVARLKESDRSLYLPTLNTIKEIIKTSTSSVTAVPKPLKFLRPHYESLEQLYDAWESDDDKLALADTLSVLGMTFSDETRRDTLKYRLLGPSQDIGSWGHEYMRHLALQIGQEYHSRAADDDPTDDLIELAKSLVPFFISHNAEPDAVDILSELEMIEKVKEYLDEKNYSRVCLYMQSMVPLLPYPDNDRFLRTAFDIYEQYKQYTRAMVIAIRLNDQKLLRKIFDATDDKAIRWQMAFLMARQRTPFEFRPEELSDDITLEDCFNNVDLAKYFKSLGEELNILDPKSPADIYKAHLKQHTGMSGHSDPDDELLADSFVNALVNAGFGTNSNVPADQAKSKPHVSMNIAASHGLLNLWDMKNGSDAIYNLLSSSSMGPAKNGYALAFGAVVSSICTPENVAYACLEELLDTKGIDDDTRCSIIMGLGIAYAGTCNEIFLDKFIEYIEDPSYSVRVSAMAAHSLGLIFVGSIHSRVAEAILSIWFDNSPEREAQLDDRSMCFMNLGLALLYLGRQEDVEISLDILKAVDNKHSKPMALLADICAWAGTGNVLKIQQLLQICTDDGEKENPLLQSYAVIGMALVAMGEEIGQEMYIRQLGHLMHYGSPAVRNAVPLALGLLLPSNPQMKVYDTLSRYTHDTDLNVATNAIFAMGLVGAGTNNARLALLLRQLSTYYYRDPMATFMVKFSQGLLHLGKGTISLNPFHTDRQVLSRVGAAGLLTVMVTLSENREFVLDKSHHLLYYLIPSMYPRFLVTLDEELKPLAVNVRIGQAVDVAGQAGRPKTITGWQTQSTPVLLAHGERAELEDEKYLSLSGVLEGIVILRKNPDWVE